MLNKSYGRLLLRGGRGSGDSFLGKGRSFAVGFFLVDDMHPPLMVGGQGGVGGVHLHVLYQGGGHRVCRVIMSNVNDYHY